MKKMILVLAMLLACLAAFAGDWSFTPITLDPLHKQYAADSWNFDTRGQVIHLLDGADFRQVMLCTRYESGREEQYFNFSQIETPVQEEFIQEIAQFRPDDEEGINNMLRVKTGFSIGLLRTSFRDFSAEFDIQGAINLVFDAEGGTDCLGFDGIYFVGMSFAYSDLVTARFGFHHYSGHYGDEIEEDFMLMYDELGRNYADRFAYDRTEGGYISRMTQYVRQDSLIAGVSVTPLSWLRLYTELDIPPVRMNNIRPWVLIPNYVYEKGTDSTTMDGKNGYSEGIYEDDTGSRTYLYDDAYKAMAINLGVEFTIPCGKIGNLTVAYDVKFNQEGQTLYQIGGYDKDNAWDVDHNVLVAFELSDMPVTLELIYHNGRMPLMNFYWYHCSYVSAGFSVKL